MYVMVQMARHYRTAQIGMHVQRAHSGQLQLGIRRMCSTYYIGQRKANQTIKKRFDLHHACMSYVLASSTKWIARSRSTCVLDVHLVAS